MDKMGNETTADADIRVSGKGPAIDVRFDGGFGAYEVVLAWRRYSPFASEEERVEATVEWVRGFADVCRDENIREKLAEHVDRVSPRRLGVAVLLKKDAPRQLPETMERLRSEPVVR